jgi:hypothetical protein
MAKSSTKKLDRLSIYHDQNKNGVFLHWIDGLTSVTLHLTPEQAIAVGDVGNMAKVYRESMEEEG